MSFMRMPCAVCPKSFLIGVCWVTWQHIIRNRCHPQLTILWFRPCVQRSLTWFEPDSAGSCSTLVEGRVIPRNMNTWPMLLSIPPVFGHWYCLLIKKQYPKNGHNHWRDCWYSYCCTYNVNVMLGTRFVRPVTHWVRTLFPHDWFCTVSMRRIPCTGTLSWIGEWCKTQVRWSRRHAVEAPCIRNCPQPRTYPDRHSSVINACYDPDCAMEWRFRRGFSLPIVYSDSAGFCGLPITFFQVAMPLWCLRNSWKFFDDPSGIYCAWNGKIWNKRIVGQDWLTKRRRMKKIEEKSLNYNVLPYARTVLSEDIRLIYEQLPDILPLDRPAITQGIPLNEHRWVFVESSSTRWFSKKLWLIQSILVRIVYCSCLLVSHLQTALFESRAIIAWIFLIWLKRGKLL